MKKVLLISSIMLSPVMTFAAPDISDCVKIGYLRGTMTAQNLCETHESCENDKFDAYLYESCIKNIKTPEECAAYVEQVNKKIESENFVYRCPANTNRLAQKNKEKNGLIRNLVDMDGKALDQEQMIADTENVYLFKGAADMFGAFNSYYHIFGPADSRGMNLAIFE